MKFKYFTKGKIKLKFLENIKSYFYAFFYHYSCDNNYCYIIFFI
jgi:hypothetical protein